MPNHLTDKNDMDYDDDEDYEKISCYCGQPRYGQMIHCSIEWIHVIVQELEKFRKVHGDVRVAGCYQKRQRQKNKI